MKTTNQKILVFFMLILFQQLIFSQVKKVEAIGITVSDMKQSVSFFTNVLQFHKITDYEVMGDQYEHLQGIFGVRMRIVKMQLGDESFVLTQYLTPKGRPIPIDSKSNDLWFQHIAIVVSNMDSAFNMVKKYNVEFVSSSPQTIPAWNKNAAGIKAFYFRDPDGHNLELIYFPKGKGNPKWQNKPGLFLGIDHTAIGISHTSESLNFYQSLLGLNVAGESFNYGTEQEHLNNVFGASLHITGLKALNGGPGIEFLEYLAPRTGRKYPEGSLTNDLWNWETTLLVDDVKYVIESLRKNNIDFISSDIIRIPDSETGYSNAILVRDPDGHSILIVEN